MRHCTFRPVRDLPVLSCIPALPRLQFSSAHAATRAIATSAGKNGRKDTRQCPCEVCTGTVRQILRPTHCSNLLNASATKPTDSSFDLYSFLYTKLGEGLPPGDGLRKAICETKPSHSVTSSPAAGLTCAGSVGACWTTRRGSPAPILRRVCAASRCRPPVGSAHHNRHCQAQSVQCRS